MDQEHWRLVALDCSACSQRSARCAICRDGFLNGKIFTADPSNRIAQAFSIQNGRFQAVGANDAVKGAIGPHTRVVDLRGQFVVPGLGDDHFHDEGGGPNIDLSDVGSVSELLARIGASAKAV